MSGLFDPDERDRAVTRALMIGSMLDNVEPIELIAGVALANDDAVIAELQPFTNALLAARLAYKQIPKGALRSITDPRLVDRVRTAEAFLDGAQAQRPVPFGGRASG